MGMGLLWLVTLLVVWGRFERLPYRTPLLIALLLWPLILIDDNIRAFGLTTELSVLSWCTLFIPTLQSWLLNLSVNRLVLETPPPSNWIFPGIIAVLALAQLSLAILPADTKLALLESPPSGGIENNWPIYCLYLLNGFTVLVLAVQMTERLQEYRHCLSDQVVDVQFYKMPVAMGAFGGLVSLAFAVVIMVTLIGFDLVMLPHWPTIINLLYAAVFLVLFQTLMLPSRFSPAPFSYQQLEQSQFSQEQMRVALGRAEQAIIRYRAYKKIGLRLRQLADAAGVEPLLLAAATRTLLKRNFRAFIYHYRLEYAKKVLLRTDAKVSSVAKRLGFNSEKFLSGMFIKYVEKMGQRESLADDSKPSL